MTTVAGRKWYICGMLLLASMTNYLDRQTLAVMSVRITNEFQLTQEQYGNLELVFGWAFAAGSLVFGVLVDRISVRWMYPAVLLLWSIAGFATAFVHNYTSLLICRTLLGFFESGHWPCGIKTTQGLLSPKDRAMGNSVLQSGTSVGAILTPIIVRLMLTPDPGSWRISFQIIGAIGLAWIAGWFSLVKGEDFSPHEKESEGGTAVANAPGESIWKVMVTRRFVALVIVVVFINICWQLLRAWLPKFLQQGRGYSESEMLTFTSIYYVATDIGCLGAGALTLWLSTRGVSVHRARTRVYLAFAILTALAAVAAMLPKGGLLFAVLLVVGMGALGVFPSYYALSQELTTQHQGKVTGITGVFAWLFSAPVHKYFGRLVDQTHSFDLGIALVGLAPLIGFVAIITLWNSRDK